jgi:hypothetical protein
MREDRINRNNDDSIHLRSLTSLDQQQNLCSVGMNYTDYAWLHGGNLEVHVAYIKTAPCICFTNSRQVTVSCELDCRYKSMYIIGLDVLSQTKICCYKQSHSAGFYGGKGKTVPVHALKAYGERKVYRRAFLTLGRNEGNWSGLWTCGLNSGDRKAGTLLGGSYSRCGSFGQQKHGVRSLILYSIRRNGRTHGSERDYSEQYDLCGAAPHSDLHRTQRSSGVDHCAMPRE